MSDFDRTKYGVPRTVMARYGRPDPGHLALVHAVDALAKEQYIANLLKVVELDDNADTDCYAESARFAYEKLQELGVLT